MIGDVIRKYRTTNHLSQAEMAKKLGVSQGYISALERKANGLSGKPYVVSYSILKRLSSLTGIAVKDLEKEAHQVTDYAAGSLTDEELELIKLFRQADDDEKSKIHLCMYYIKLAKKGLI